MPQRRRRALDDVDHERVGKAPRHARVLDPAVAEKLAADPGDVDQGLRSLRRTGFVACAPQLGIDDAIDQRPVHVVDADDLVAADGEARFADRGAGRALRLRRNIQRDQNDESDREHESGEDEAGELVGAGLVDRELLGDAPGDRDL